MGILVFAFGLFQTLASLLCLFLLVNGFITGQFLTRRDFMLAPFLLFLFTFVLPSGLYFLKNSFGPREIFSIAQEGITTRKHPPVKWEDLRQIRSRTYPGPRMRFYLISLVHTTGTRQKIFFTSDSAPSWTAITDLLGQYAGQYGILYQ